LRIKWGEIWNKDDYLMEWPRGRGLLEDDFDMPWIFELRIWM
jgi:hypothetical protein